MCKSSTQQGIQSDVMSTFQMVDNILGNLPALGMREFNYWVEKRRERLLLSMKEWDEESL